MNGQSCMDALYEGMYEQPEKSYLLRSRSRPTVDYPRATKLPIAKEIHKEKHESNGLVSLL